MLMSLCSRLFFAPAGPTACRARCAPRHRGRSPLRGKRRGVGWLEHDGPELRRGRIEDERAQVVLRRLDRRVGDDDTLFVARDLGLRLHDVDRRHRADLDALLVVLQRLLRERQRLLLRLQVADRVRQIPVRVLDAAQRAGDDALQLDVRQLARLLAVLHLLSDLIDREVAGQRLREAELHVRVELRAVVVKDARRRQPLAVEVGGVIAAPGQRLAEPNARVGGPIRISRHDDARRRLTRRDSARELDVRLGTQNDRACATPTS